MREGLIFTWKSTWNRSSIHRFIRYNGPTYSFTYLLPSYCRLQQGCSTHHSFVGEGDDCTRDNSREVILESTLLNDTTLRPQYHLLPAPNILPVWSTDKPGGVDVTLEIRRKIALAITLYNRTTYRTTYLLLYYTTRLAYRTFFWG